MLLRAEDHSGRRSKRGLPEFASGKRTRRLGWAELLPAKPFLHDLNFLPGTCITFAAKEGENKALNISMQAERRRQPPSSGLPTPGL